jgi:hypothetical protein
MLLTESAAVVVSDSLSVSEGFHHRVLLHYSITYTADCYTSVAASIATDAANAAARNYCYCC